MENLYTIQGSSRHAARILAVQLLYQMRQTQMTSEAVLQQFETWYVSEFLAQERKKTQPLALEFLKTLVTGVATEAATLKSEIDHHLTKGWTLDRLPLVLTIILELGIYEIRSGNVPGPILLNEYVEITKSFFIGEEFGFVNGLLDSALNAYRPIEDTHPGNPADDSSSN